VTRLRTEGCGVRNPSDVKIYFFYKHPRRLWLSPSLRLNVDRCYFPTLLPPVLLPDVTSTGVTSRRYFRRCYFPTLLPPVLLPDVASTGVTSQRYFHRCYFPTLLPPVLLPDVKTLESIVDHPPLSSAEVKTEWNYTSIAPIYCHAVDNTNRLI
jgi:hypothetical protein